MSTAAVNYSTINGVIVYENRNGVEHDYMRDPLGSTVGLIDSTQTITDTFEYWPYGEVRTQTGTTGTPFTFVGTLGYFLDAATQLSYVRARYYAAALARWLTVDRAWPVESAYGYARAQPCQVGDPSGEGLSVNCFAALVACLYLVVQAIAIIIGLFLLILIIVVLVAAVVCAIIGAPIAEFDYAACVIAAITAFLGRVGLPVAILVALIGNLGLLDCTNRYFSCATGRTGRGRAGPG